MRAGPMAALTACWTFLPILLLFLSSSLSPQVQASGVFELYLREFSNDRGLNEDGNCCNGYRSEVECSAPCKTFFWVCLTHYQVTIARQPKPQCTFGEYTTPVLADNGANFTVGKDLPMANPLRFPVKEFSWPGDFSLILEAWHDSTLSGPSENSPREAIARFASRGSAQAGLNWYTARNATRYTEVIYSYRFVCDPHYYGPTCNILCRKRDDQFGHYYCSDNGTKVCRYGWQGEYCDVAICKVGCHSDNGFCDTPEGCDCRSGWEGPLCDQCTPHPDCQHGSCKLKPYECNCHEGWGGLYCNQDLNFCTHHSPCRNGGTCSNTGSGSYTCNCQPGFTGVNCEVNIDHCQDQPCLHGSTCLNMNDGFKCNCPQGLFGVYCEQEANYCRLDTCYNGGTCEDHDGSYRCMCAKGYAGFHCEVDTGGCKEDTCKNGGHCVSGECICPANYFGPTCEDDGIDYCAHQPCENGGTCIDLNNDFKCRCVAGFVGPTCQINVDDCEMRPCANGGSCTDLINDFKCACSPGWIGKDCSINQDNCLSQPCKHGAMCRDRIDDYECQCKEGFWGKDCHMYEGMNTTSDTSTVHFPEPESTENPKHGIGNISEQAGGSSGKGSSSEDVSQRDLVLGLCLGIGLPFIAVVICAVFLLCRKHRRNKARDNMDKERQQNFINNMTTISQNRGKNLDRASKCVDDGDGCSSTAGEGGGSPKAVSTVGRGEGKVESDTGGASAIFTTSYSHHASALMPAGNVASSMVKKSNEEQQNINRLNSQQHQAMRSKAASKNFIRDSLGYEAPYPTPSISSHRDSRVYDVEKPIRRLEVDTLSGDTQVDISTYRRHSGDISIIVKPNLAPEAETVRRSVYLEPSHSRRPRFTEDYLATEV